MNIQMVSQQPITQSIAATIASCNW